MRMRSHAGVLFFVCLLLCGCGDADTADVSVTVYGEPYAEEGIEADDVEDGWAIRFASFEVTLHVDHLFCDSLVTEVPALRFQAFAEADLDQDGEITEEELAATDIGSYDPGSDGGIDDLWSWLVTEGRLLGHVNGEGHCRTTTSRD